MRRRALLLPLLAAGCGVTSQPYTERRQWPINVSRASVAATRPGGPVIELRTMREGPGMAARGLQEQQPDGSLRQAFYDEWLVPPAQGIEEALRNWLVASGKFTGVLAPGSRAVADFVVETELTSLVASPAEGRSRVVIGVIVIEQRSLSRRVVLQRRISAEAPLAGRAPADQVQSQLAALARAFTEIEAAL